MDLPKTDSPLIAWLFDSDPALRWQTMQDLLGRPAAEVAAERARVATEGLGAQLLALQAADGAKDLKGHAGFARSPNV